MPTIASGIYTTITAKKQSALGSAVSGAGGKTVRRVTGIFKSDRDMFESNEIVTHHQSTGSAYGQLKADGNVSAELSAGSYADFFGSILEKDFAAGVAIGSQTVTYGGSNNAWTITGTGFLTGTGLKIGDVVRCTNGSVTANNSRNFLITGLTNTVVTFRALDEVTVTSGSSTTTVVTVVNKKTNAPVTAHTKDYYGIEVWRSDVSKSELYNDMRVGQIAVNMPATGNATLAIDFVGLSRTKGTSQVLTSPSVSTTAVMAASNGFISVNGVSQSIATSLNFTISNSAANAGAVIGSNSGQDVTTGRIKVSGSFMAQFDSTTLSDLYDAETNVVISAVIIDSVTATSDFISFTMPRVKITSDAPDDGEKAITRTYSFIAEYYAAGGSGVNYDQTIISIQDSAA
jgi:hypothetical protein